jgi:hypothetical protein
MVLIQLLLPVAGGAGPTGAAAITETRQELAARFKGLTAYIRSPATGLWTAPDGRTEQDTVVMVEVVTERFDRAWWREYAGRLADRFQQDVIHVRALRITLLDEEMHG